MPPRTNTKTPQKRRAPLLKTFWRRFGPAQRYRKTEKHEKNSMHFFYTLVIWTLNFMITPALQTMQQLLKHA